MLSVVATCTVFGHADVVSRCNTICRLWNCAAVAILILADRRFQSYADERELNGSQHIVKQNLP